MKNMLFKNILFIAGAMLAARGLCPHRPRIISVFKNIDREG